MRPSYKLACLRTARLAARHPLPRTYATASSDFVRIVEVGPRDGLQNEKQSIPVQTKIELVNKLAQTGLRTIEAGSFVSPKWVPQVSSPVHAQHNEENRTLTMSQMANSSQILEHILVSPPTTSHPITYQWLLPNIKGLDSFAAIWEAKATGQSGSLPPSATTSEISIFTAATESFTQKNTNCSIAESLARFEPIMAKAKEMGLNVRAYISVALGCPYEGPTVDPHKVANLAVSLLEMGADEISVADTTGMGTAPKTAELLKTLSAAGIENCDLALHFHDTYGQALVNTVVALEHGVRTFDSALAGLGGCPFSPGATGNVASEDLVHLFHSLGLKTGVNMEMLSEAGAWISNELQRPNESRAGKATLAQMKKRSP